MPSASTALDATGQGDTAWWPYDPVVTPTQLPAAAPSNLYRAELQPCSSAPADIKTHLSAGHPVALGLDIYESFYTPPNGDIRLPDKSQEGWLGGHAVLAVGCAEKTAEPYLIIRNSWGTGWGDRGYGYLPETYLAEYLLCAAVMTQVY